MKTKLERLNKLHLKHSPLLYTLLLLVSLALGTLWNLWFQERTFQAQFNQQAEDIKKSAALINQDLHIRLHTLAQYTHSSHYNEQTFLSLLENTQKTLHLIYAAGIIETHPPSSLTPLIQHLHEQGFENFRPKHQLLIPYSDSHALPAQPAASTTTLITHVFPFTPEVQALLGEQLTPLTLPEHTQLLHLKHYTSPFFAHRITLDAKWQMFYLIDTYCFFNQLLLNQTQNHHLEAQLHQPAISSPPLIQTHSHPAPPFTLKTFETTFPITLLGEKLTLTLKQNWIPQDLNNNALVSTILITFLIFSILWWLMVEINQNYLALGRFKERLEQLQTNAHDAIIVTDESGYILGWSPQAQRLFGFSQKEAMNSPLLQILPPPNQQGYSFQIFLKEALTPDHPQEFQFKNKQGQPLYVRINVTPVQLEEHTEYFFFIQDMTHQHKQAQQIHQLAYFDPLTGLENRVQFLDTVAHLIQHEPNITATLLFLDLDGFKQVNDTLGHNAGDELLKIVAQRLKGFVTQNDRYHHLARFGGDEFLLFLPFKSPESLNQKVHQILKSLSRPYRISTNTLTLSASLGIALYPQDGQDVNQLLRHADNAMYAAKAQGKNTFSYYNPSLEKQTSERFKIEGALKTAIKNREFFLVYQPKIDTQTLKLKGFEALIRWIHPELGFVPPDKFIAMAEESHLIIEIGNWVIETAIQQLKDWQQTDHLKNIPIAINLSSKQIIEEGFFPRLQQKINDTHLPPKLLELELTERSIMSNAEEHITKLQQAQDFGFVFAVDDFGTGYSSLSYLKKLPLHTLKVDKSFVDGLPDDEDDQAISSTIITLAHALKLNTVAEGVETQAQYEWLKEQGCNVIQGYYFAKPLKTSEIEDWWQTHTQTYLDATPENPHE